MKITKCKVQFILLFLIPTFLISCTNHLSKEKAKEEIIKKRSFPNPLYYTFNTVYIKDLQSTGAGAVYAEIGKTVTYEEVKDMLNFFQSKGLVKIEEVPHSKTEDLGWPFSPTTRTWTTVKVLPTELGRKYLNKENESSIEVKLWEADITSIDEIKETPGSDYSTAVVEYTVINKGITPFGEFFRERNIITKTSASFDKFNHEEWGIITELRQNVAQ